MATKSPTQIIEYVDFWFPTNTRGEITAARQRAALFDLVLLTGTTAVIDIGLNVPPDADPDAAYVIGPTPTGEWTGQNNKIAYAVNGEWLFYPPPPIAIGFDYDGLQVWVTTTDTEYTWTGTEWLPISSGGDAVLSVFGRTGVVVAVSGDYSATLVTNDSSVSGATVAAALDALLALTGTVADGDYGDITVSGSGSVWTINNSVVTLAKIQDIASNRILGRTTAGPGIVEQLSTAGVTAMLDLFTSGLQGLTPASGGGTINFLRADGTWGLPPGDGHVSDGNYGDITVSAVGLVWTINANVVTFAKFQQIATDRLVGRDTTGTGNVEEISLNATLEFTGAGAIQRAALTGDATASAGSNALTLATVNANVGSFGSASMTLAITANAKGQITAISATSISVTASQVSDFTEAAQDAVGAMIGVSLVYVDATPLLARAALTGDITAPQDSNTTTLAAVNAGPGTFGDATHVAQVTVNGKGLVTTAVNVSIAGVPPANGDYGDITVSGSGLVWTIDAGVVTFAKMQNIATDSLIGRDTAGTGAPENILLNATLSMDGSGNLRRAALTGDITAPVGSNATTLATVNANVGTFGSVTQTVTFTVNGKGLVTAASQANIAIPSTQVTDFTEAAQDAVGAMIDGTLVYVDATPLLTRAALTGDVTAPQASNVTTLATVNANVGTFGSVTQTVTFTVNGKGLITAASQANIAIPSTQITDFTEAAQDATGAMVGVSLIYVDATPLLARAALTGDVTAAQDSNATTIANDAVTFAKMQNIVTDSLIGRDTAGTGDPENITLNATLSMDGAGALRRSALTGDITAPVGSNATTLATVNANVGTFGDATHVAQITANGKGLVTAVTNVSIAGVPPADGDYGDITVSGSGLVWTIDPNVVTYAKFQQGTARSVLGVTGNAGANYAPIQGTADQVLVINGAGTALTFSTVATAGITAKAVTFAKIQDIATDSLIGRDTAGTGVSENILLNATLSMDGSGNLQRAALTGDITAPVGSNATTLATVNANVGSFGSATQVMTQTVNGKGLTTAAANVSIAIPSTQVTDFTEASQDAVGAMVDGTLIYVDATPLLTRAALTGDITAPQASNATTLATVNANVGTFGSATKTVTVTFNGKGLATAAAEQNIAIPASQVTDFDEAAQDAVGTILVDSATIDFTYTDATPSITAIVIDNSISNAKLRQGVARSVVGVTGNATANVADIQGTTDQVLRINGAGTALAFGAIDLSKSAAAGGVLQAVSFPALTGDITTVAGALATTLATVNANVGTFGSVTKTVTFNVNGKGLITAASQADIAIPSTQVTDFAEAVDDRVAALCIAGTGITITYNDVANTLTFATTITQYTDEMAQDAVGAMVDSTLVYVDATPLLTRAALTGDVTAPQASNVTTIASNAVTNTQLADMATQTIKGRTTAGTGDPEDLTPTQAGAIIGSTGPWVLKAGDTMTGVLNLSAGTAALPALVFDGDTNTGFYHDTADQLNFAQNATYRWTFGPFISNFGTNIPIATATSPRIAVHGGTASTSSTAVGAWVASNLAPARYFAKSRSATVGTLGAAVTTNDNLGAIWYYGDDGSAATFQLGGSQSILANELWTATAHGSKYQVNLIALGTVAQVNAFSFTTDDISFMTRIFLDGNSLFQLRSSTLAGAFTGAAGKVAYFSNVGQDGAPVFHDGTRYKMLGDGGYQTIATNVAFTITPMTSPRTTRHTGTLTANRIVTLSNTNAYPGYTSRLSRTGLGVFTLDCTDQASGVVLKNMALNQWADFTFDGTNFYVSAAGVLP